jgi:hypothetical protein
MLYACCWLRYAVALPHHKGHSPCVSCCISSALGRCCRPHRCARPCAAAATWHHSMQYQHHQHMHTLICTPDLTHHTSQKSRCCKPVHGWQQHCRSSLLRCSTLLHAVNMQSRCEEVPRRSVLRIRSGLTLRTPRSPTGSMLGCPR